MIPFGPYLPDSYDLGELQYERLADMAIPDSRVIVIKVSRDGHPGSSWSR